MITNYKIYTESKLHDDYFDWEVGDEVYCLKDVEYKKLIKGNKYIITRIDKMCIAPEDVIVSVDSPQGYYKVHHRSGKIFLRTPDQPRDDTSVGYSWAANSFTQNPYHPIIKNLTIKRFDL